jgi:hypothetical protein
MSGMSRPDAGVPDRGTGEGNATIQGIVISGDVAHRLVTVLELCEAFLANPTVRAQLAEFCLPRSGVTSGWLIEMLGLHALHLKAHLDDAARDQP